MSEEPPSKRFKPSSPLSSTTILPSAAPSNADSVTNGIETADNQKQGLASSVTTTNNNGTTSVRKSQTQDSLAKEREVGITRFISQSPRSLVSGSEVRFRGILKKRYTDFVVREIGLDGTVCRLRGLKVQNVKSGLDGNEVPSHGPNEGEDKNEIDAVDGPVDEVKVARLGDRDASNEVHSVSNGNQDSSRQPLLIQPQQPEVLPPSLSTPEQPQNHGEISTEDQDLLLSYFNTQAVEGVLALYKTILAHPARRARDHNTVRTEFTSDRSIRSQIHQNIRRIFNHKIESQTDNEGMLVLSAALASKFQRNENNKPKGNASSKQAGRQGKLNWLDRGGEYLHFTLYKENKDTMEVTSFLGRQLHTPAKTFQFAGTKDRRAVTTQRMSAFRIEAGRLAGLNRTLRNAVVGDFDYHMQGLDLGDLGGNEFVLTLRECDIEGSSSVPETDKAQEIETYLQTALKNLHEQGFLNYFGLQRFGSFATRTDLTGRKILQGDFEGACQSLLEYSEEALAASQGLDQDTNIASDDKARAQALHMWTTNKASQKPLEILPRKFTAEASVIRHLSKHPKDYPQALLMIPRNLRLMYVHAYQSLVWNVAVGKRWELYQDTVVEGDLVLVSEHTDKEVKPDKEMVDADGEIIIEATEEDRAQNADDIFERARPLTALEAADGQYSILDVVLPLPGFDVLYPANASGEFYATFMKSEEGGKLDPYNMRRRQKDFSLSGSYRKVIARIGPNYNVEVHRHTEENQQFVQTDLEALQHKEEPTQLPGVEMKDLKTDHEEQPPVDTISVVVKFQLGSSQYATMALRELSRGGVQAYKPEFGGRR